MYRTRTIHQLRSRQTCSLSNTVTDNFKINRLPLFSNKPAKTSKQKNQITSLKNDCSLFGWLYISRQTRDDDLNGFFAHENQPAPPSLSQDGKLRVGNKSAFLSCLENKATSSSIAPSVDAKMFDGAVVVQMLHPRTVKTFKDYSQEVFIPYVSSQLQDTRRVDAVWDVYLKDSLKASMREKRGKGTRRRVLSSAYVPKNWNDFLRVDKNKTELFSFLSHQLMTITWPEDKMVLVTNAQDVLCSMPEFI